MTGALPFEKKNADGTYSDYLLAEANCSFRRYFREVSGRVDSRFHEILYSLLPSIYLPFSSERILQENKYQGPENTLAKNTLYLSMFHRHQTTDLLKIDTIQHTHPSSTLRI